MAKTVDYSEIYQQLEEARRREKQARSQKLRKELEALVADRSSAAGKFAADMQAVSTDGKKADRKLQENTAAKGLGRSGYMDSLLMQRKEQTQKSYDENRRDYSGDRAKLAQKEENLRTKASQDLASIDSKYDNKLVTAQQKEQAQRLSLEKAALAAAAKTDGKGSDKNTEPAQKDGNTSQNGAKYPEGHVYTEQEIASLLRERDLPDGYIEEMLNRAVHYGNIRTFFEENSGKIIKEAGQDVWRAFMQAYKRLENWYREAGKGPIK